MGGSHIMSMLIACLIGYALAVPDTRPSQDDPAREWPPLPDFVRPVDYLAWYLDITGIPPEEDAWPLWQALGAGPESLLSQREQDWLWGCVSKDDWIPGLFTGIELYTPEKYPWNPQEHWDWEEAYQLQQALGLHDKIRAASLLPQISMPAIGFSTGPYREPLDGVPPLLSTMLHPSLAIHRTAAKVLLQNAWRAPGGQVDSQALLDAVEVCLRIAEQLRSRKGLIVSLTHLVIREAAYDSVIAALHHGVFGPTDLIRLKRILAQWDGRPFEGRHWGLTLAVVAEMLQFGYAQESEPWSLPPKLNHAHVRKLWMTFSAPSEEGSEPGQPDPRTIENLDPFRVVELLAALRDRIQQLKASNPLLEAERAIEQAAASVFETPELKTVYGDVWLPSTTGPRLRAETTRRAVHILVALHDTRSRMGSWPAHLRQIEMAVAPGVLEDPYSGNPFIYRLQNGQPLLYSVAANGRDDGGCHTGSWGDDGHSEPQTRRLRLLARPQDLRAARAACRGSGAMTNKSRSGTTDN